MHSCVRSCCDQWQFIYQVALYLCGFKCFFLQVLCVQCVWIYMTGSFKTSFINQPSVCIDSYICSIQFDVFITCLFLAWPLFQLCETDISVQLPHVTIILCQNLHKQHSCKITNCCTSKALSLYTQLNDIQEPRQEQYRAVLFILPWAARAPVVITGKLKDVHAR